MQDFLPVTREDMKSRGWEAVDFVYVTGDAYVDHPSFGSAIIGRLLERKRVSRCSGNRAWVFLLQPETWIPW